MDAKCMYVCSSMLFVHLQHTDILAYLVGRGICRKVAFLHIHCFDPVFDLLWRPVRMMQGACMKQPKPNNSACAGTVATHTPPCGNNTLQPPSSPQVPIYGLGKILDFPFCKVKAMALLCVHETEIGFPRHQHTCVRCANG